MEGTKWIIGGMILAGVIAAAAAAQTAAPAPAFEVASVKRYTPQLPPGISGVARRDPPPTQFQVSGTRVSVRGNLLALVRLSYDLEASHVRLSPELADNWAVSEVYEIDARAPGDATPTLVQVCEMTQTLLAERFQLKVSRRNQAMPFITWWSRPAGQSSSPASLPILRGPATMVRLEHTFASDTSISQWPISWNW